MRGQFGAYVPVVVPSGLPWIKQGHSFTTANGFAPMTPGSVPTTGTFGRPSTEPWPNRANRQLNMSLANRGVAGDMMRDTAARMLGFGTGAVLWTPDANGLLLIESVLNDCLFGGTDPLHHNAFSQLSADLSRHWELRGARPLRPTLRSPTAGRGRPLR